ncbi:response regulator [Dyadobacter sp. CY261]|uniref:response regulator n=1 Tax=Dyadobacter sp. CY261 TaxID=2907203 RepID=UPI001F28CB0F|nr:response regulator [Dyadobacter sp. CY261]MCF0072753.1 response regulator [Dyadobacter sp. CY261]
MVLVYKGEQRGSVVLGAKTTSDVNILIVEDQPISMLGLTLVLSESFPNAYIQSTNRIEQAYPILDLIRVDVLIVDSGLLGDPAHRTVSRVLEHQAATRIIVCTISVCQNTVEDLLSFGVSGIISKKSSETQYEQAVRKVMQGGRYYGKF